MPVNMAIALSGQFLLGQPVMVKPSEAEKNLVQSTTSVATGPAGVIGPYSGVARRLYVGNLHFNMTETDLQMVFEAFGQVELVQLPLDESGNCKGFDFVQFACLEDARNAQSLNGQLEIGGRTIKDKFGVRSPRHSSAEMMAALYLQVSIISQALIFVTKSCSWSYVERHGLLLLGSS
ncbi:hypothetical protein AHAS_Ahas11G0173500 [Arachis hypogaea]